jgi:tetratricopeptide (TPR) repeat protein
MQSIHWNALWAAVIVLGSFVLLRTPAFNRNLCYLALLKDNWDCARAHTLSVGIDSSRVNVRLALRVSIHDGDWSRASILLPIALYSGGGWNALWVIQSAQSQLSRGNSTAAESALDLIRNIDSPYFQVWYALGKAYEEGGLVQQRSRIADSTLFDGTLAYEDNTWFDRAALAYRAGLDVDSNGAWAEGIYDLAKMYYRQARWNQVIQVLEPVLANATDEQIQQPISGRLVGGPDWQGVYLLLAHSYQQIDDWDGAIRAWQRMVAIQGAKKDWTLNFGLRSLGAIEARQAQFESALEHMAQALDLAFTFPDDYRTAYERDTWAYVINAVRQTRQQSAWAQAQKAAVALTERFPNRASAWYIFGVFEEAECHQQGAMAAYAEARRLMPERAEEFSGFLAESDWHCMNIDLERP